MFLKPYKTKQLFLAELYPWEAREVKRAEAYLFSYVIPGSLNQQRDEISEHIQKFNTAERRISGSVILAFSSTFPYFCPKVQFFLQALLLVQPLMSGSSSLSKQKTGCFLLK